MSELDSLKQSQAAKRKQLAEWRAKKFHDLTLPSGLVVKIKDVDLIALAFDGKIPNTMLGMVEELQRAKGVIQAESLDKFGEVVNILIRNCVVDPQISDAPGEDSICIDELNGADRIEIFMFANREVGELTNFRPVEEQPVESVQPGNDLQPAAEQIAGP